MLATPSIVARKRLKASSRMAQAYGDFKRIPMIYGVSNPNKIHNSLVCLKASRRMAQTTAKNPKSHAMLTMTRTNCPSFCCAGGGDMEAKDARDSVGSRTGGLERCLSHTVLTQHPCRLFSSSDSKPYKNTTNKSKM